MKLRNKKTGGIDDFRIEASGLEWTGYTSLKEFCEDYEDYEEPKGIQCIYYVNHFDAAKIDGVIIGFETKKEAKKALEKLKAWKRLKDKGFEIKSYGDNDIEYEIKHRYDNCIYDLELLLFGGEE